jgi:DNA-binding protein HU-beta
VNKAELVKAVEDRLQTDRKTASAAVDTVIDIVVRSVAKGEKVAITGFGVFEKRRRNARTARNPATGAAVKVKATSVPAFRAGAAFKEVVSGAKKLDRVTKTTAGGAAKKSTAKKTTARAGARKTAAKRSTAAKKTTGARKTAAKRAR